MNFFILLFQKQQIGFLPLVVDDEFRPLRRYDQHEEFLVERFRIDVQVECNRVVHHLLKSFLRQWNEWSVRRKV